MAEKSPSEYPHRPVGSQTVTDERVWAYATLRANKMGPKEAAAKVGITHRQGMRWDTRKDVKEFIEEFAKKKMEHLIKESVKPLAKLDISLASILARYWELANLTPEETRGSITGQISALDGIRDTLGLTAGAGKAKEEPKEAEPAVYQPEWMRNPDSVQ